MVFVANLETTCEGKNEEEQEEGSCHFKLPLYFFRYIQVTVLIFDHTLNLEQFVACFLAQRFIVWDFVLCFLLSNACNTPSWLLSNQKDLERAVESILKISLICKLFTPLDGILTATLTLITGADLFSELQQDQHCLSAPPANSSQFSAQSIPWYCMLVSWLFPSTKWGPTAENMSLAHSLEIISLSYNSATWLSYWLNRLFSSLTFGANPTMVVFLTVKM